MKENKGLHNHSKVSESPTTRVLLVPNLSTTIENWRKKKMNQKSCPNHFSTDVTSLIA